ncbi:GAF domain-containing sensor histidine kinase [Halomonas sp. CH40]
MQAPPLPDDEDQRLSAMWRYTLRDMDQDPEIEALTALTRAFFQVPIVLVAFLDKEWQRFKSHPGTELMETARNISFCGYAITASEDIFEVPDAWQDPRFVDNPLVTGEPYIRYYAGAPLITPDGDRIGSLCLIDHKVRDLSRAQLQHLPTLAAQVMGCLMRRYDQRLHQAVNSADIGLYDWDIESGNLWCNEVVNTIFGVEGQAHIDVWLGRYMPQAEQQIREQLTRSIDTQCAFNIQLPLESQGPGCRPVWVDVSGQPQVVAGKTVQIVGTVMDITALKHKEAELAQRRQQAHHQEKMRALGQMAAGIAHDFNNILQVINGHADLLNEELQAQPTLFDNIEQIQMAGQRGADLVEEMLLYASEQPLECQAVNLADWLENYAEGLKKRLPSDVHCVVHNDANVTVLIHPSQMMRVMDNLCQNAAKAMPDGGLLTLSSWQQGATARLRVSDTGQGIAPEHLDTIFAPFFTNRSAGKGTGLGLAIVNTLIQRQQGRIHVKSQLGEGTDMTLTLPLVHEYTPS